MISVVKYTDSHREEWDKFVESSINGTFLFFRDFMEYHKDRFDDFSLLFYKDDKLISIIPGNHQENIFFSHQGLTYGGFIFLDSIKIETTIEIFTEFELFLKKYNFKKILFKCIPTIYHKKQIEYDLYCLFVKNYKLTRRDLSFAIDFHLPFNLSKDRRYRTNKSMKNDLEVAEEPEFEKFMSIVNQNLMSKYNLNAVHNFWELEKLHNSFKENIKLLLVKDKSNKIIAGSLIFIDNNFIHTQYLHADSFGKQLNALEFLIKYIFENNLNKRYLIFGTSTENGGKTLNYGLSKFKEGFGSKGFTHDFFEKKL